jgi:hypothetical protein
MSVHKKLMQARIALQSKVLNKSGHNKFAGYKYFELGDFLPTAQEIFSELGLCGVVSYTADVATLTITDTDDGTSLAITSPMGSAALKGCHEVQNIGAVETYQRRYLWVTAFEIVEHDALDATVGDTTQNEVKPQSTPSAQKKVDIDAVDEATRVTIMTYAKKWHEAFKYDKSEAYRIFCEGREEMISDATAQSALMGQVTKEEDSAFRAIKKAQTQPKEAA